MDGRPVRQPAVPLPPVEKIVELRRGPIDDLDRSGDVRAMAEAFQHRHPGVLPIEPGPVVVHGGEARSLGEADSQRHPVHAGEQRRQVPCAERGFDGGPGGALDEREQRQRPAVDDRHVGVLRDDHLRDDRRPHPCGDPFVGDLLRRPFASSDPEHSVMVVGGDPPALVEHSVGQQDRAGRFDAEVLTAQLEHPGPGEPEPLPTPVAVKGAGAIG